jgi:hypothetical protein
MMMIVILVRGLSNRSTPAAILVLMRRPAIPLSGAAFVRQGALLSGCDRESLALLAGFQPLIPPAQK